MKNSTTKVYIARSNDIKQSLLATLDKQLHSGMIKDVATIWHNRSYSYDKKLLLAADGIIVLVDSFNGYIGKGTYDEIQTAISLNKPVKFAYFRQNDQIFQFYNCSVEIQRDTCDWSKYASYSCGTNCTYEFIKSIGGYKSYKKEVEVVDDSINLNHNNVSILLVRRRRLR